MCTWLLLTHCGTRNGEIKSPGIRYPIWSKLFAIKIFESQSALGYTIQLGDQISFILTRKWGGQIIIYAKYFFNEECTAPHRRVISDFKIRVGRMTHRQKLKQEIKPEIGSYGS